MMSTAAIAGATAGANAMLRVRLKADGRLVEILPDGSERAIASDPQAIALAAHNAARAAERVSDASYARNVRGQTGLTQLAFAARHRRAGRDRAQLGAGQAFAARSGAGAAQGDRRGPRCRLCGARQAALISSNGTNVRPRCAGQGQALELARAMADACP